MTDKLSDPFSRRDFVGMGISAGWAQAVSPITGLAITTPADNIVAELTKVPTKTGSMPAYFREGDVTKMTDMSQIFQGVVNKVPQTQGGRRLVRQADGDGGARTEKKAH